MTTRTDIIQHFIDTRDFKKYLEVGCYRNENFNKIRCEYKVSVDPDPEAHATYCTTSDDFFKNNRETFDIVFIDGLHEHSQVYKDIMNSLYVLNKGGVIVMHDCLPKSEAMQRWDNKSHQGEEWTGDTWKAFVQARNNLKGYKVYCIDEDYGCGVIDTMVGDVPEQISGDVSLMEKLTYSDYLDMQYNNKYGSVTWAQALREDA